MKNVIKKVFLFSLLIFFAFQFVSAQKIQSAKFSLSNEAVIWKKGKPVIIKGSIESLSDSKFELPAAISIRLVNQTGDNFYTFYRFTEISGTKAKCNLNTLPDKDSGKVKGAGAVSTDKNLVAFAGGEKKDFSVDLSEICWADSLSSFRGAGKNLFETVPAGRYQLYFEMDFDGGMKESDGIKYSTFISLVSNKIEIEIK